MTDLSDSADRYRLLRRELEESIFPLATSLDGRRFEFQCYVGEVFSFVPPSLLGLATGFHQGEALVAGPLASHPALIRFGERLSQEGGSDVPATWAAANA